MRQRTFLSLISIFLLMGSAYANDNINTVNQVSKLKTDEQHQISTKTMDKLGPDLAVELVLTREQAIQKREQLIQTLEIPQELKQKLIRELLPKLDLTRERERELELELELVLKREQAIRELKLSLELKREQELETENKVQ